MNKKEILRWNSKYDEDHPWWTKEEKRLGDKFRQTKTLTKADLRDVVVWKFKELPARQKRILRLVEKNTDKEIQLAGSHVFSSTSNDDLCKINPLDDLVGVGPAVASTILALYDPKNYGVFDIHVWREFFGKEPKGYVFTTEDFQKVLTELRKLASKYDFDVRIVEKAHFKKNLDENNP